MSEAKLYRIGNQEKTLVEWCKFYGAPNRRTWARVNTLGWSLEEALTTPKVIDQGEFLTVGNVSRTFRWWSKKTGIPLHRLYDRRRSGMTPEQIVNPNYLRHEQVTLWGRTGTVGEFAEEKGIKYQTVYYRTAIAGLSLEAALSMPVAPNGPRRKGSR